MKWLLLVIELTSSTDVCDKNRPFPLVRHMNEVFDTRQECEEEFRGAEFYKRKGSGEIVGFCIQATPLYLSPKQLSSKVDQPVCKP